MDRNLSLWLRWETEAAERGCAESQHNLGFAYLRGQRGLNVNLVVATKWFRLAALQGHEESACNMGVAFEQGEGVTQNFASAAQWYRKAVSQGSLEAMVYLGDFLSEGQPGVEQDCRAAAELYSEAIERGSVEALWAMGCLFHHKADGVLEENLTTAHSYWQRAADLGHADAARMVGYAYFKGHGGYERSFKLAKKYVKASAAQGNEAAITNLKLMTACVQCGTGSAPGVCAGCKQVHYCNKECQLQHWCDPTDPHMSHCDACRQSPIAAKQMNNRPCASCGAHGANMLCSDCRYEGDPRRKVR